MTTPTLSGVHHVKFAVSDLDAAVSWYERVLRAERQPRLDHYDDAGDRFAVMLALPGAEVLVQLRRTAGLEGGLAARAATHPEFVNALVALAGGDLVPVAGGVLVRDGDGKIIGAVGVSGHLPDGDEECALRGIAACSLLADTGA